MTDALEKTDCPDCGKTATLQAADWSAPEFTGDGHGYFCTGCGFQLAANDERRVAAMLATLCDRAQAERFFTGMMAGMRQ